MYILAPSLLAADFTILGEQIREIQKAGVNYLHIDVMDGMFVPSISFGMPLIASIRSATTQFFDVHLMITDPIRYIKDFAECGLCGTAAVISPVGKINDHGHEICFPSGMEAMGPVTKKLYDTLTGIQMGLIEAPEGWIQVIE